LKQVFKPGQMTELGHCIAIEWDQNPVTLFFGYVHASLRAILQIGFCLVHVSD
jgi:hypothetical protein